METKKPLTDSEKLDAVLIKIKRMETIDLIHTIIVVVGFLGIVDLAMLLNKAKTKIRAI